MGDFVSQGAVKTAVRELSAPIADAATFNTLVDGVVSTNPWTCTSYESGGVTIDPVVNGTQAYVGRITYENTEAKIVGYINIRAPTTAALASIISSITGVAGIATQMGGTGSHDSSEDTFSRTLKCHKGTELFTVTFKRDRVTIGSYEDNAIMSGIETWADTKTELA
jgi:hypothetical protein